MILVATTNTLQAVLSGVPSAQWPIQVSYADLTTTTLTDGQQLSVSNSTTPVTILSAPAASTQRQIKNINIFNNGVTDLTLTISIDVSGTPTIVWKDVIPTGKSLTWSLEDGWAITSNASGSGPVASVFGRSGNVVAVAGDYSAALVTNTPAGSIAATDVQGAIDELDAEKLSNADNSVALAKLINAAAQYNILGRKTAGAGEWEDCAYTDLKLPRIDAVNNFSLQQQITLNVTPMSLSGLALLHIVGADSGARTGVVLETYGASSQYIGKRSNGTAAAPSGVLSGQNLLTMAGQGYGTTAVIGTRANISISATENWTDTASGASFNVNLIAPGTTTLTNGMFRVDVDRGIQVGGGGTGNIVIDQNRIHRPRSYTVGTLPTITTTGIIHCSDLGGGPGLLQSDGTNWNRVKEEGTATIATDAAHTFTWTYLTNAPTIRGNAALTAVRTATLSTTGARNGARAHFVRLGGGAFNWDIAGGTTFSLTAADQYCTFEYDGAAWNLIDAGSLSISSGGVSSVFGRSGAVVALSGDYDAAQITNTPAGNIVATDAQAAINELDTEKAGLALANFFTDNQTITGIGSGSGLFVSNSGGNGLTVSITGGAAINVIGDNTVGVSNFTRYQTSSGGVNITQRHARGTFAAPTVLSSLDQIGANNFNGYDGAAFQTVSQIITSVVAATPSATDMEGRMAVNLSPAGSVTLTEFMRWQYASGLSMYGANVVIDSNRIFRPRSYTIGTLPTITTTGLIHCSDLGGGQGLLQSDGTGWNRVKEEGTATIATDAGHTFTWTRLTNAPVIRGNATLTALRTATLSTTGARNGDRAHFVRLGGGAFNWDIAGGTTFSLTATNQYCTFEYDGTTWNIIDAGSLSVSSGGGVDVEDEGVSVLAGATTLNFVGAGVTATNAGGGQVDVTIPGGGSGGVSIGLIMGIRNSTYF